MFRTRVLFNWQPSCLDTGTITDEFPAALRSAGVSGYPIFVRPPSWHRYSIRVCLDVQSFHRDENDSPMLFVTWADRFPTEVMFDDGSLLETRDGDVILIDNIEARHRVSPAAVAYSDRWFAKAVNVRIL